MKALSIKNPWALLIAHGIKDIENRTWRTTHRGRILLHCSSKSLCGNIKAMFIDTQWKSLSEDQKYMITGHWPNGCIIGEVDIVDCVQDHPSVWAEHRAMVMRKIKGEQVQTEVPVWNWVLENAVLYDQPIENVKGALSIWEYKP